MIVSTSKDMPFVCALWFDGLFSFSLLPCRVWQDYHAWNGGPWNAWLNNTWSVFVASVMARIIVYIVSVCLSIVQCFVLDLQTIASPLALL